MSTLPAGGDEGAEPEIRGDEGQRLAQVRRVHQSKLGRRLHPEFLGQLRNRQESSWARTPTLADEMVLSPGDVGATWCREPDQE
jgi:hypothetical protein